MPELPPAVVDLRADPNPQIRAAAIVMILTKRHPQALDFAKNSLQDAGHRSSHRRPSRASAVTAGPDALAMLVRIMLAKEKCCEPPRCRPCAKPARMGKVWNAAGDKAWRVRRAVAEQLALAYRAGTSTLAYKFLADDSGEFAERSWPRSNVAAAIGRACAARALKEPTFETRRLAGEQPRAVARRLRNSPPIAAGAARATRRGARSPMERGVRPSPITAMLVAAAAGSTGPALPGGYSLTPEHSINSSKIIDDASRGAGRSISRRSKASDSTRSTDWSGLCWSATSRCPDAVYKQYLATRGAEFAALDLSLSDVNDRRRAADRLEELAKESPPRPLVTARIARLVVSEQDGLVWRGLVAALDADAQPAADDVALSALSHESPEVRRMGLRNSWPSAPRPMHVPCYWPPRKTRTSARPPPR